jgi:hypothetical protein
MIYRTSCVGTTADIIHLMQDNAKEITYRTFRKYAEGLDYWAAGMKYDKRADVGLTLKNDWHVSYHKSTYMGMPCVYLVHSAIEHIWV